MNIIIFSKDRACQLDLLIRSMKKNWINTNIKVLYTFSDSLYQKGYEQLITKYPNISFIKEKNFRSDLLGLVDTQDKWTVFLVDDIVFKNTFSFNNKLPDDVLCLSLRLHPYLTYCYAANIPMKPIGKTEWNWKGLSGDYGYPMSLDGHIFRTEDIYPLLKTLPYKNPNSLETILAVCPINRPKMMCLEKSIIINNPCNKVQTNNPNRFGNISAEFLNEKYLKGYVIDLDPFQGIEMESCHKELPITFNFFI